MKNNENISTANTDERPVAVIVHAAWQEPYAWATVKELLESEGITVLVPQLPGHGDDQTNVNDLHMRTYIDYICEQVANFGKPVTLVGHSLAGMIISGVAEQQPALVKELVYVAAYVPKDGDSAYSISGKDRQSQLGASLLVSEDQRLFDIVKADIGNIFCQDGSADDLKNILSHYRAEPAVPFGEPVKLSTEKFGSIPKHYIQTLQDHGIGNILQKEMISASGITGIYQLDTGHTPSLSAPRALAGILAGIVKA